MVNVLIVSDIRIYRDGLREIVGRSGQLSVISTAASLADALSYLAQLQVDVVVLDMGITEALTLTQTVTSNFSRVKVVAFGLTECQHDIVQYAEAGISGYVAKDGSADDLINAILRASQGELACSAKFAAILLERLSTLARKNNTRRCQDNLTRRELQVAELVAQGFTNSEIASVLAIRVATTKAHVHHILEKLGARHRSQVIMHLHRNTAERLGFDLTN
jgi:two-component system, NarL family, nitrate/nitrite response regulator NarL